MVVGFVGFDCLVELCVGLCFVGLVKLVGCECVELLLNEWYGGWVYGCEWWLWIG